MTSFPPDPDLDAVRRLRDDVAAPSDDVLAAARARLTTHMDNAEALPAVLARTPRRRPSRVAHPLRWRVAASVAAAAVIGGGAYALTADGPASDPSALGSGSGSDSVAPGSSSAPRSTPPVVRFANAAQVLDAAAANSRRATPPPGAGQYRRVSIHSFDVTSVDDPPDKGAYQFTENRSDTWTPSSGTAYERDDNYISVSYPTAEQRRYAARGPGGVPKRELSWYRIAPDGTSTQIYPTYQTPPTALPCTNCPPPTLWDSPDTVDYAKVSRDPATLRASLFAYARSTYRDLVKYGKGDQFTVGDLAYDGATTVVTRPDLPSDLRAALYQVIKTIPGITLIRSLANYDGRTGIAVSRVDTFHVEHALIFTPDAGTFIGDRSIALKPSREFRVKAGTLVGASAVTVSITGKPAVPTR